MLNSADVLVTVRERLKSVYPCAVYLEDSKENCDTPCFFLSLNVARRQAGAHKFLCHGSLYITYFSCKGETDAVLFCRIKDEIAALFHAGFRVQDRHIKIRSISAETDGEDADMIFFSLLFEYYDVMGEGAEETPYKINKIHQEVHQHGS